jgi:hypothetical protein
MTISLLNYFLMIAFRFKNIIDRVKEVIHKEFRNAFIFDYIGLSFRAMFNCWSVVGGIWVSTLCKLPTSSDSGAAGCFLPHFHINITT